MTSLKQFCEESIQVLTGTPAETWAEVFVARRLELQRLYLRGKILSTTHGADIFRNILACLAGEPWEEKGEYGNNFRAVIAGEIKAKA